MALQLPPLPEFQPRWEDFQAWWQQIKEAIERNEEAQELLFDAINEILGEEGTGLVGQLAILGSYTIPTLVITAVNDGSDIYAEVEDHIRRYGDGTELPITGTSTTGLAASTTYGIYYDDTTRQDGTPTFRATTDLEEAQHNYVPGRHYVGTITTPAAPGPPGAKTGGSPPAGSGYTAGAGSVNIT